VTFLVTVRCSDMRQISVLAVVSAAAVLGAPGLAGAEVVVPASQAAVEMSWPVAAGPGGGALAMVPTACGCLAERDASGRWTPQPIVARDMFPQLVAWGPGAAAILLTETNAPTGGWDLFALRRPPGAARFAAPVSVALGGRVVSKLQTATDRSGDLAFVSDVKGVDSVVRTVLVAATPRGSIGPPQDLAGSAETTAVAVGHGRVVVAYASRRGVYVRTGIVGAPLGAPQLLPTRSLGQPGVAIDDAGVATVVFNRRTKSNFDQALLAARARPGERFGVPIALAQAEAEFEFTTHASAAGTTTALVWHRPYSEDSRVHVAIARGAGRFGRSEAMPASTGAQPYQPVAAVSPTGDVLLAYANPYDGAVHATMRRAGSPRFAQLHVISKLGEGSAPSCGPTRATSCTPRITSRRPSAARSRACSRRVPASAPTTAGPSPTESAAGSCVAAPRSPSASRSTRAGRQAAPAAARASG
jgi:hypothetical protein